MLEKCLKIIKLKKKFWIAENSANESAKKSKEVTKVLIDLRETFTEVTGFFLRLSFHEIPESVLDFSTSVLCRRWLLCRLVRD